MNIVGFMHFQSQIFVKLFQVTFSHRRSNPHDTSTLSVDLAPLSHPSRGCVYVHVSLLFLDAHLRTVQQWSQNCENDGTTTTHLWSSEV